MERLLCFKKRIIFPEPSCVTMKLSAAAKVTSWSTQQPSLAYIETQSGVNEESSKQPDPLELDSESMKESPALPQETANDIREFDRNELQWDQGKSLPQRLRDFLQACALGRRSNIPTPSPSSNQSETDLYKILKPISTVSSTAKLSTMYPQDSPSCVTPTLGEDGTNTIQCTSTLDPQGKAFITWLLIVTVSFMYNCWVIPLRSTFPYQTDENVKNWMIFDYTADFIYIIDLILLKPRVMYLSDGFWVKDGKLTRRTYFHKLQFKMDVLSLVPLDLLCLKYGFKFLPLFRLPRLLKIQTFWEFYNRCDSLVSSAYVVRVARTLTYMLYLVHLNACAYFAFSAWEGLGTNGWVFNGKGNAYIRCFYFATKTATSIGKNPKPENEVEYMFMTCSWLMGVFVFALLIGQIRDIIATATRSRTEYRKLVDETLTYMRRLNLPLDLQERVKLWFKFTWEQQHTFNESSLLDSLPHKMKTDVAINVHIQTLSKVQLFADCDPALLRELVLKLRPVLFLPGDYVCRKGEVGKEMYIVKTGMVQVMGDTDAEVLATLKEGSVFGEISLLSLTGGNRRTATVKAGGFSNLFILNKSDLNEALVHYPDAQEILKKKAQQLMKENAERERLNRLRDQSEEFSTEEESDEATFSGDETLEETSKDEKSSQREVKNGSRIHEPENKTPPTEAAPIQFCDHCHRRLADDAKKDTFQCNVTVHQEMETEANKKTTYKKQE